ncbi:hypothetical protein [Neobacillus niacini]|uniref:hypothetical protein n=1 Tax=Neobacillus niacini TaxID=86668 RepID=UPI00398376DB
MRIRVVNSISDTNGDQIPLEMIDKEYEVVKQEAKGVWVTEGKLEAFVHYEELEILELSDSLSAILGHYLRNIPRDKFQEDMKDLGCNHLL